MKLPINKIICGDCLEVIKDWPDNCVDLVLTDPPYGINIAKNGKVGGRGCAEVKDYGIQVWDSEPFNIMQFQACQWVSENQIVFGFNHFCDVFPPTPSVIVWHKDNTGNFADCELAWTSFKTSIKYIKWRWNGMLQEPNHPKEKRQHPTQKPLGVMLWILERYSKPDDLILDPFCGSGTICIAAKMLGRRYIGIDISPEYCEIARKRIKGIRPSLFEKPKKKIVRANFGFNIKLKRRK